MSESTDYNMSWLGCASFGVGSFIRLQAPEPVVFSPLELSNCALWYDANNSGSITTSSKDNISVLSWSNLGTAGDSATFYSGTVESGVDTINALNVVSFSSNSSLLFPWTRTSGETSLFTVCKLVTDISVTGAGVYWLNPQTTSGYITSVMAYNASVGGSTNPWFYANIVTGGYFATCGVSDSNVTGRTIQVSLMSSSNDTTAEANLDRTALYLQPGFQGPAFFNTDPLNYLIGGDTENVQWQLAELVVYDRRLLPAEVTQVQDYLALKWAV